MKTKQFLIINSNHTACHILEQEVEIQDSGNRHGLRMDLLDSIGSHAFVRHIELFIDEVSMKQCGRSFCFRPLGSKVEFPIEQRRIKKANSLKVSKAFAAHQPPPPHSFSQNFRITQIVYHCHTRPENCLNMPLLGKLDNRAAGLTSTQISSRAIRPSLNYLFITRQTKSFQDSRGRNSKYVQ